MLGEGWRMEHPKEICLSIRKSGKKACLDYITTTFLLNKYFRVLFFSVCLSVFLPQFNFVYLQWLFHFSDHIGSLYGRGNQKPKFLNREFSMHTRRLAPARPSLSWGPSVAYKDSLCFLPGCLEHHPIICKCNRQHFRSHYLGLWQQTASLNSVSQILENS